LPRATLGKGFAESKTAFAERLRLSAGASKKTIIGKKKDADRSGIGTRITGTVYSLTIAGSRTPSYLLMFLQRAIA